MHVSRPMAAQMASTSLRQRAWLSCFSTVLLISLFGVMAFTGLSRASAQTSHAHTPVHVPQPNPPQVTCVGNGCNGLDPAAANCAADARIVQMIVFRNSSVELRYSPRCGTKWGWVMSKVGRAYLVIRTQRTDGLTYTFASGRFSIAWSAMVYAPAPRAYARACGGVNGITGCTAYF